MLKKKVDLNTALEFEKPILELEEKLEQVKEEIAGGDLSKQKEYSKLVDRVERLKKDTFSKLTSYQKVQLSRHFDRPQSLDYFANIFTDFVELKGDRVFRDDAAIVGGLAKLDGRGVVVVGHQRGKNTQDRLKRNFGMPYPEGYRKAVRLFKMAEKFRLPLFTFIDTQGAYPGIEAEERGQAMQIATNILELAELKVPIICTVIGEGGSGGALALGVSDRVLMLENSCYSVISPEGCASILWRDAAGDEFLKHVATCAEQLRVTATAIENMGGGIVDEVVSEPLGGAHNDPSVVFGTLKEALTRHLEELLPEDLDKLRENRYTRLRALGPYAND